MKFLVDVQFSLIEYDSRMENELVKYLKMSSIWLKSTGTKKRNGKKKKMEKKKKQIEIAI